VITLVIDASIAVKWVVDEEGTSDALALRHKARLIAPDLLVAEYANILWKKVQRAELSSEEALVAARLLQGAEIELIPMLPLLAVTTSLAIALDHPAYDCVYLALAAETDCRLVTADERLLRKLAQSRQPNLRARAISLVEAAKL
jgi:predicted nucleic acid-binding protein